MSIKKFLAIGLIFMMIVAWEEGLSVSAQEPLENNTSNDEAGGLVDTPYRPSDSPWLRLPEEMRNWPPIQLPEPTVTQESSTKDPTATEVYNISTKGTIVIPSQLSVNSTEDNQTSIPPYQGLLPTSDDTSGAESVIGTDGRSQITATTNFPWRTIVKLLVTFPSGVSGGCSGALIDDYHVLTAGHCMHMVPFGGWADSIQVVPGYDDGDMPYYYAWSTDLRSYTGWTQDQNDQHDWGLITLDRNIGSFTGWMGRQTDSPDSSIYNGSMNIAGYPDDLCSGECLYFDADNTYQTNEFNHWYYMDTFGGQSGAPVWRYDGTNRYILTVHAYGLYGSPPNSIANHGTRLNQDKYDRIPTWIGADSAPTDRPDLIDDGQLYSGFSPTTVTAGSTTFSAYNDVRNTGTASSGGFYVSYYASTNTTITTFDYLIGTQYVSSIDAFNWKDANWSGTFPSGIPAGTYWVGWIIDSGSNVTEFDEDNNVAYKSSYKLTVNSGSPPPIPASVQASDGTYIDKVRVSWSSVSGATGYYIYRATSVGGTKSYLGSRTTTFFDDTNATPGATYYYFVRAYNSYGSSSYSNYNTGWRKTAPAPSGPPVDVYFLVDLSGSFRDDLRNFKAEAPGIITTLKASNSNIRFGLGRFEDYPISPFGRASSGDKAYERVVNLTFNDSAVRNAIAGLSTRFGDDAPESQLAALYQTATGAGQNLSGVGYPGASIPAGQQANFRSEAEKMIILWTDASFHLPGDPGSIPYPGPSFAQTSAAIRALGDAYVYGIFSGGAGGTAASLSQFRSNSPGLETADVSSQDAGSDLSQIVAATGAFAGEDGVDCDGDGDIDISRGQPLVCGIGFTGEGVGDAILSLVEAERGPALTFIPILIK